MITVLLAIEATIRTVHSWTVGGCEIDPEAVNLRNWIWMETFRWIRSNVKSSKNHLEAYLNIYGKVLLNTKKNCWLLNIPYLIILNFSSAPFLDLDSNCGIPFKRLHYWFCAGRFLQLKGIQKFPTSTQNQWEDVQLIHRRNKISTFSGEKNR